MCCFIYFSPWNESRAEIFSFWSLSHLNLFVFFYYSIWWTRKAENNPRHRAWSYKQRKKIERTEKWRNRNERKILEFNELWSSFLLLVMLAARKLCTHDEKTPEKRDGRARNVFRLTIYLNYQHASRRFSEWLGRSFVSIEVVWRSEISSASAIALVCSTFDLV